MRTVDNITLIGMPGSGKSTIGVLLAKKLGYRFIDSDLLIQEQEGRLLKDIIAREGDEGFSRIENQVNAQIQAVKTVIAPGGSVVYCKEAMEHLSQISLIVYLRISCSSLKERLGDLKSRGVLLKDGGSSGRILCHVDGMTLDDLYAERAPLYERYGEVVLDVDNLTMGEVLDSFLLTCPEFHPDR